MQHTTIACRENPTTGHNATPLRYLMHAPPYGHVWRKAFFFGTGRWAVAHTRPEFAKNALGPVGIPLVRGALGAGQWTQPPRKGVKAWGEGPLRPKEISRYRNTLGQVRAADNTAGRSATRQMERCQTDSDLLLNATPLRYLRYLMHAPPYWHVWHKAFFLGGSRCRAVAHTRPEFAKMPLAPSAFPLLGVPQAPSNEPNPPRKGVNAWGRSATLQLERFRPIVICFSMQRHCVIWCTPHITGMYGTRPFWGGTGRRAVAHTRPEFAKNALGPVGILLVRGASGAGQWTQPSRRR